MKPGIRVFILAGGKGRRLGPLTTVIPKPLVPIGDSSILELLIRQLVQQGLSRITISVGYLGNLIQAVIGDGERLGAEVDYTVEDSPLGTAGALGLLRDVDPRSHVLTVNGDTFTDLDLRALITQHISRGADATIATSTQSVPIDFGVIHKRHDGFLDAYIEKPVEHYCVSMGVNVVQARHLKRLSPTRRVDLPDFFQEIQRSGGKVYCHEGDCFWLDLGRIDDVKQAQVAFATERHRFLQAG